MLPSSSCFLDSTLLSSPEQREDFRAQIKIRPPRRNFSMLFLRQGSRVQWWAGCQHPNVRSFLLLCFFGLSYLWLRQARLGDGENDDPRDT